MGMRAHLLSGSVFYSYTRTVHVLAAADLRAERRKRPTKFGNLSAPSTNVNLPVRMQNLVSKRTTCGRPPWLATLCRSESLENVPALYSQGLIHSCSPPISIAYCALMLRDQKVDSFLPNSPSLSFSLPWHEILHNPTACSICQLFLPIVQHHRPASVPEHSSSKRHRISPGL